MRAPGPAKPSAGVVRRRATAPHMPAPKTPPSPEAVPPVRDFRTANPCANASGGVGRSPPARVRVRARPSQRAAVCRRDLLIINRAADSRPAWLALVPALGPALRRMATSRRPSPRATRVATPRGGIAQDGIRPRGTRGAATARDPRGDLRVRRAVARPVRFSTTRVLIKAARLARRARSPAPATARRARRLHAGPPAGRAARLPVRWPGAARAALMIALTSATTSAPTSAKIAAMAGRKPQDGMAIAPGGRWARARPPTSRGVGRKRRATVPARVTDITGTVIAARRRHVRSRARMCCGPGAIAQDRACKQRRSRSCRAQRQRAQAQPGEGQQGQQGYRVRPRPGRRMRGRRTVDVHRPSGRGVAPAGMAALLLPHPRGRHRAFRPTAWGAPLGGRPRRKAAIPDTSVSSRAAPARMH